MFHLKYLLSHLHKPCVLSIQMLKILWENAILGVKPFPIQEQACVLKERLLPVLTTRPSSTPDVWNWPRGHSQSHPMGSLT